MTRSELSALFVAAATAALIATPIPSYAADEQGSMQRAAPQDSSQSGRARSEVIGGTPGAATEGVASSAVESRTSDLGNPYADQYLSPFEVRTPGARSNSDD